VPSTVFAPTSVKLPVTHGVMTYCPADGASHVATSVGIPTSVMVPATVAWLVKLVPATGPLPQAATTVCVPSAVVVPGAHAVAVYDAPSTPPARH